MEKKTVEAITGLEINLEDAAEEFSLFHGDSLMDELDADFMHAEKNSTKDYLDISLQGNEWLAEALKEKKKPPSKIYKSCLLMIK